MHANSDEGRSAKLPAAGIPARLRLLGALLRALFICILLVLVARISSPQNERIWSAYERTGDLIRVILGFAVGFWVLAHVLTLPKLR